MPTNDLVSAPVLQERFAAALSSFLAERRAEHRAIHPETLGLVDHIERIILGGGRRIRPGFCYWGFRAGGGADGRAIVRAAASLELLHTMALIHDDLIDDAPLRRGLPSVHAAASSGSGGEARGRAIALVAGDLAAVWAEQMFMTSGFGPGALAAAAERSFAMRGEMAAGQYLGLAGAEVDPGLMAALKGGSYSVEGPLLIGAALAEAGPDVEASLRAFGRPLGMAFQAADDLLDGDADDRIDQGTVRGWLAQARAALDAAVLGDEVVAALEDLASVIG